MIIAWIIAGTLDILAAFIQYVITTGKNPLVIGNYIASGFFGQKAFTGGTPMMIGGFIFHYFIAFVFTFFYFKIFSKLLSFSGSRILRGIIYGIFVWAVMRLIVLPLSNVPALEFHVKDQVIAAVILMICIGIPLSFMAGISGKK